MKYAGFWKRVAAALIDALITMFGGFVIGFIFGIIMVAGGIKDPAVLRGMGNILGIILAWLYYAVMESSPTQGTLGKMALGIKVTDLDENRVSFGKASGRYFGKFISTIILFIGFIMVAFTQKKQGLHDIMAGCLVVNK
ncbi:MAG: RDD family protein [Elusimicrobiota bacterium]